MVSRINSWQGTGRICSISFGFILVTCLLVVPLSARATTVTLDASQDSWMDQDNDDPDQQGVNHGSATLLDVKTGNSTQVKRRSLVQFDLSSIPQCATVSSATLNLRIETVPGTSQTHAVHKLLKAWTESGVTWLTTDGSTSWDGGGAGASTDRNATASATAATGTTIGATISWTVTTDVAAFVATPASNHGWLLKADSEGNTVIFVQYDSREASTTANRPKLDVTYTLTDANCDDAEVCTDGTCTESGCDYANNSLDCSDQDGLFCNGTDTCSGGTCSLHTGDPCSGPDGDTNCSESCDEASDDCFAADPDGTDCRLAAGPCDLAETCSGGACPTDGFKDDETVCRAASLGQFCDAVENCTGSSASCPPDLVKSSTVECRGSAGVCDLAENCDGSTIFCPADAKKTSECRALAGVCDVAEICDGSSNDCPADAKSTAPCRADAGECDVAESCDGVGNNCPTDGFEPNGTACTDDGLFCTGDETCQGGTCTSDGDPCAEFCKEDTDECTASSCATAPLSGCLTAQKSVLLIKNKDPDTKDRLVWKWIKGQLTTQGDFADPLTTATYGLCIYENGTDLIATMDVPAGSPPWSAISTKGYKYKDLTAAVDGAFKLKLKSGAANKSKALVKGRGAALDDPDPATIVLPVKVQLVNNDNGKCFEANYTTFKVQKATKFKAKQ